MIIAASCAGCNTGHQDFHPVGWTKVRVTALTRKPDENEKRVIETPSVKEFFFCEVCFEPWWGGKQSG
jgi:hypothetical protein